mmetsp:Transcript_1329/g.2512  ORF Transcript_1329/g.2512 Transcript_1329/m.2512 type:complete len:205 (-) Transcript_1329:271-885(-)
MQFTTFVSGASSGPFAGARQPFVSKFCRQSRLHNSLGRITEVSFQCACTDETKRFETEKLSRRRIFRVVQFSALGLCLSSSFQEQGRATEDLCTECTGSGLIECELCDATGLWEANNATTFRTAVPTGLPTLITCPNCRGRGKLVCTKCIGTGLGDVRGLLRRTDLVKPRRDGSIDFVDCDRIPACATYGATSNNPAERIELNP